MTRRDQPPERTVRARVRMTGAERREQLIEVGRSLFADRGYEGTAVEEIAARAGVSKPVVYEHFGGKEGLYAVIVDREVRTVLDRIRTALVPADSGPGERDSDQRDQRGQRGQRELVERAALALLDYIDTHADGFRIIARDSGVGSSSGSFSSVLGDVAAQVTDLLAAEFRRRRLDPKTAPLYAQMLVGMIALTGQWWLEVRKPRKEEVAAHLVNLAWNGLHGLEPKPTLGR